MKKTKKLTLVIGFFILLFINSYFCYANNSINIDIINRYDGLSNLSVSHILEDKYGFLWFATQGGLNYYNGDEFIIYENQPFVENDLSHNLIQTMFYDIDTHTIWIGTYNGVSKFNIDEKKFTNYTTENSNLSNSIVIAIEKDKYGNIWFGTMEGLNKLNTEIDKISNYPINGDVVRDLKYISDRLFIGTYEGLYTLNNEKIIKEKISFPSKYIMVIKNYEKDILTLGLWEGGIVEYNYQTKDILKTYEFENKPVYTLLKTNETLYAGTWGGGLFTVDLKSEDLNHYYTNSENKIPHNVIYSMHEDKSGIIWIGTNGGGLLKINPRKKNLVKFSSNNENPNYKIKNGKVNDILEDDKGNLWFAIYENGLNKFNPNENRMYSYSQKNKHTQTINNDSVMEIFKTHDGEILIGNALGVSKYNEDEDKYNELDILPTKSRVYSIEENNNYLWIGTYYNGLYRYNKKTEKTKRFYYSEDYKTLSDNLVYDILIDNKNRVWVATNKGLNLLKNDSETFEMFYSNENDRTSLGSDVVRSLFLDSEDNIWLLLGGGGVAKYNEKSNDFTSYAKSDGLASNSTNTMEEAADGKLWIGTNNGLSVFSKNFKEKAILTPLNGIGGWEFNSGSYADSKGNIYFGGVHGITVIPSDFTYSINQKIIVYIESIYLKEKSISQNSQIIDSKSFEFDYNSREIKIKLSSIYNDDPSLVNYYYKLNGLNDQWVNIGNNKNIRFSNLKPGNYVLNVKAKSINTDFSKVKKIYLKINKPWFLKNWAFFFFFLIFIIILYFIHLIRQWYLFKYKNIILTSENKELENNNEELEKIATIDSLTGLYNRRYFNVLMKDLLNMIKRDNQEFSFILLDIDFFKNINDQYGHLAGDDYLIDISKLIKSKIRRSNDFAVRYAGDEFVLVMFGINKEDTIKFTTSLLEEIRNLQVRQKHTENIVTTSASIGIVHLKDSKEVNAEKLFKLADDALYRAKKNGRDNIEIVG